MSGARQCSRCSASSHSSSCGTARARSSTTIRLRIQDRSKITDQQASKTPVGSIAYQQEHCRPRKPYKTHSAPFLCDTGTRGGAEVAHGQFKVSTLFGPCLNKDQLGEQGEGNCRRYPQTCRG